MKNYIILLISVILDGVIYNITMYQLNHLTYFTPMCTVVSLIFVYDNKNFIKLWLLSSVVYGTLYMSNLLLSLALFFVVMQVIKLCKYLFEDNFLTIVLQIIVVIAIYDGLFWVINFLTFYNSFSFDDYIYKVSHSIIFNLLYGTSLYYLCDKSSSKNIF